MAESKLAKFVEDIIVPPRMVDIIVDGEVLVVYLDSHVNVIVLSFYFATAHMLPSKRSLGIVVHSFLGGGLFMQILIMIWFLIDIDFQYILFLGRA